jgi:hypothetical protein
MGKFVSYVSIEGAVVGGVPSPRGDMESGTDVKRGEGTPPTAEPRFEQRAHSSRSMIRRVVSCEPTGVLLK